MSETLYHLEGVCRDFHLEKGIVHVLSGLSLDIPEGVLTVIAGVAGSGKSSLMEKCPTYHVPVLLRPCIEALVTRPDGVYADMTFGGGGHSRGILEALGPNGHLYSFDQDADAERNATQTGPEGRVFQDKERFTFVRSNFRYLKNWMRYYSPLTRSPKGECLASLESACGGDTYERLQVEP